MTQPSNQSFSTDMMVHSLTSPFNIFIGSIISFLYIKSYSFTGYYLKSRYARDYTKLSASRKIYVCKNLIKSVYLTLFCIFSFKSIVNIFYYDIWDIDNIHTLGMIYALPDIISLFRVKKLPRPTKVHHTSVLVFATMNMGVNYSQYTFWRALIVFTFLSAYCCVVNYYLAMRFLISNKKTLYFINSFAFTNYLVCVSLNIFYQYKTLYFQVMYMHFDVYYVLYFILSHSILWDDFVLLKVLFGALKTKQ